MRLLFGIGSKPSILGSSQVIFSTEKMLFIWQRFFSRLLISSIRMRAFTIALPVALILIVRQWNLLRTLNAYPIYFFIRPFFATLISFFSASTCFFYSAICKICAVSGSEGFKITVVTLGLSSADAGEVCFALKFSVLSYFGSYLSVDDPATGVPSLELTDECLSTLTFWLS